MKTSRQAKPVSGAFPSELMEAKSLQGKGLAKAKVGSGKHRMVELGQEAKIEPTKTKQEWGTQSGSDLLHTIEDPDSNENWHGWDHWADSRLALTRRKSWELVLVTF